MKNHWLSSLTGWTATHELDTGKEDLGGNA